MKKIGCILLAIALMLTLGVGALAADEDLTEELVGSYTLVDMPGAEIPGLEDLTGIFDELPYDIDIEFDTPMLVKMMAAMGMPCTMEIREDGTANLNLFGSGGELEFDFDTLTASVNGTSIQCSYEDGLLTFPVEGLTLVFEKDDPNARFSGVFDYYLLEKFTDDDGVEMDLDLLEVLPALYVFEGGEGFMTSVSGTLPISFDYDTMTAAIRVDEDEEEIPFTVEDGVLTIAEEEALLQFRVADPGCVGPYAMCALVTEAEGDQTEYLPVLASVGLLPTLTVDEDGSGVLDLFGTPIELVFDFESMTVTAEDDEAIPFIYENGMIQVEEDGNSMTFRRVPSEEDLALLSVLVGAEAD